jgi:hypothetical protein
MPPTVTQVRVLLVDIFRKERLINAVREIVPSLRDENKPINLEYIPLKGLEIFAFNLFDK